jgi:hypothetical protein
VNGWSKSEETVAGPTTAAAAFSRRCEGHSALPPEVEARAERNALPHGSCAVAQRVPEGVGTRRARARSAGLASDRRSDEGTATSPCPRQSNIESVTGCFAR